MRNAALGLVALAVVALAVLWVAQRRLIYLPWGGAVPRAATVIAGARDVTLQTSDGLELGAWFAPARETPAPDIAVLVANGNAGNRSLRAPLAEALVRRGLSVLLFDYRGYAGNPGTPSEDGLARDVRAAYRFLTQNERIPPERIVFFGESLGAAVVAELAREHPPAGLLLRSPFTDLASVGRVHYPVLPVRLLLRDRFPVTEHVAAVDVPTAVVLGGRDSIVPPEQSLAVAEAAAGPTTVVRVERADHNDLALLAGPELLTATVDLAERARDALDP